MLKLFLGEKKRHLEKITSLKRERNDLVAAAEMQEAELSDIRCKFEPYKKQNAMLMNIIRSAEKGHNMLLNTMSDINKEIAGTM